MKRKANAIRRFIYRALPLNTYLTLLSKFYFLSFDLGLLKNNKLYEYPYFLKHVIHKGDVVIDIGANLGYLSTLFSKLVGDTGKVYAVEPVKPVLEILKKNTRKCKNIEILPYALGEEDKSIQLVNDTIQKNGFMASGAHKIMTEKAEADISFDAEMRRGSKLFENLEKLDFIKCDIEGYEVVVLRELEPIIQKFRPMLLVEARRANRIELIKFFKESEYTNLSLEKDILVPATPDGYFDMLIIPNEKLNRVSQFIK